LFAAAMSFSSIKVHPLWQFQGISSCFTANWRAECCHSGLLIIDSAELLAIFIHFLAIQSLNADVLSFLSMTGQLSVYFVLFNKGSSALLAILSY